jgi:hypothetical protein
MSFMSSIYYVSLLYPYNSTTISLKSRGYNSYFCRYFIEIRLLSYSVIFSIDIVFLLLPKYTYKSHCIVHCNLFTHIFHRFDHPEPYVVCWMPGGSKFMRNAPPPPFPGEHRSLTGVNTPVWPDMVPITFRPMGEIDSLIVDFPKKNME